MFGRRQQQHHFLLDRVEKPKWWNSAAEEKPLGAFYCPSCHLVMRTDKEPDFCDNRCGAPFLPICARCATTDEDTPDRFPRTGELFCDKCNLAEPSPGKDISVQDDGRLLLWKGIPFYARGRLVEEGEEFILASYANMRITRLEGEVDELKGVVKDLLACFRDTQQLETKKKTKTQV